MAPIPQATGIDRYVSRCSCTGWQLQLGFHWMSGCEKLSCNSARRNAVAAVLWGLLKMIGLETRLKLQAGWVVGAPDLHIRPYDVPARPDSSTPWMGIDAAVADPSRHGYLSTGQCYFKKAAAAARYVHKKQTKYNRLLTHWNRCQYHHKRTGEAVDIECYITSTNCANNRNERPLKKRKQLWRDI